MIIPFDQLPENSKIWIFPSSRKFYPQEVPQIDEKISEFLEAWKSDGQQLHSGYQLKYDRFIIIVVDNSDISLGLATHDALISFIQSMEISFDIILMDKINVCYKQGAFVQYKNPEDFKKLIKGKGVSKKTVVFNNLINTKAELEYDWEINIMDSWLGRLL